MYVYILLSSNTMLKSSYLTVKSIDICCILMIMIMITCYTLICVLISIWKVFNLNEIIYITNNSFACSSSLNDSVIFFSVYVYACLYVRYQIQSQKANNIRVSSYYPPLSLSPHTHADNFNPVAKTIRIRRAHQQFIRACSWGWFYPNLIGYETSYLRKVYTVYSKKKKKIKRYACSPMTLCTHVFVSTFAKQPDGIMFLQLILYNHYTSIAYIILY